MSRERVTITATFDEISALQRRAAAMTQAEKTLCKVPDFVRNAVAFYCQEQDRCLSCCSGVLCQVHGTATLRPPEPSDAIHVSAEDIQRVTAIYFGRFTQARGIRPQFDAAEGRAVKSLISRMGVDDACKAIEHAFADAFWRQRATILSIAADPSRHMGNGSKAQPRTSLQADSGYQGGEEKR